MRGARTPGRYWTPPGPSESERWWDRRTRGHYNAEVVFANASLARRIERAEVGLILEGARAAARRLPADQPVLVEMNGGAAVYVEESAPFNKIVGLGFSGVPDAALLDDVERQFAARKAPLQAEISTLADPDVARTLTRRGYELVGFENVLGLAIGPDLVAPGLSVVATDVVVSRASAAEARLWLETVTDGFLHPDTFDGPASHESFPREALERIFGDTLVATGFERFLARRANEVAGGAGFRIDDAVAQLNGAATLPAHRRRGVQSALLRHRLREAAARGCDIAVVTTQPGSKSQENVQKAGFALLYARAVLIKPPA
jgi:GNAT superfamily N-acetyltransferase